MLRTPVTLFGLAGVVFLAGSFVPASFGASSLLKTGGLLDPVLPKQMAFTRKGDRMGRPVPASERTAVTIVELVGVAQATIILRDRDGQILYRSDPRSGITTFSKNTDLPVVTLKEQAQHPTVRHPVSPREGDTTPQDQKHRNLVGCVGDVSPLVKASVGRTPKLCLALLGDHLPEDAG